MRPERSLTGRTPAIVAFVLCLLMTAPAHAAYPGPDGAIAFVDEIISSNWEVFAVQPDGSGRANLTRHCSGGAQFESASLTAAPDWAPDGTRIAYWRNNYVNIIPTGGGSRAEIYGPVRPGSEWSPDGARLLLAADGPPKPSGFSETDIFVMNADGSGVRNLTGTPNDSESSPAWSPEGTRITFVSGDVFGDQDLYVMDLGSGVRTRLTNDDSSGRDTAYAFPDWSPDGALIAAGRVVSDSSQGGVLERAVYVVPAAGGSPVRITDPDLKARAPGWSPSGTRVVFIGDPADGSGSGVYTMNADGSGAQRIAATSLHEAPDWGTARSYAGGPCGAPALEVDGNTGETALRMFGKARALRGAIAWTLRCPATGGRCSAKIALRPATRGRRASTPGVFGRSAATIKAGRARTLRASLNRTGRRALSRNQRLKVKATATVSSRVAGATRRRSATRTLVLRRP